ncbi:MAG: D-glycero-alpha-D-manno-heptose-1,7-bisphosphate 7-phosphatase [Armatimonadota bacterium]
MRAVFLDRDGVINVDRDDYVKNVAELKVFDFAPEAIRRLNEAGFEVFVISNQQGVAKGLIREDDLMGIQAEITRQVESAKGHIGSFYYCRHMASDKCGCRKPETGMLRAAAREHGINLAKSFMIGDSERDIVAGNSAGCRTVLVLTGKLSREDAEMLSCKPDFVAENLSEAVEFVLERWSGIP